MTENLLKTSGDTEYSNLFNDYIKNFKNITEQSAAIGAEPDLIAKIIEKSVKAKNPKTRYVIGFSAKPILFIRSFLSDKMYDKFWTAIMKTISKRMQKKRQTGIRRVTS
jgi:hypothetical protein